MKKLLTTIIIIGSLFIACQDEAGLVNPQTEKTIENADLGTHKWITLPASQNLTVNRTLSTTKKLKGSKGGSLLIDASYAGGPFGEVTVRAELTFPRNSFNAGKTFTMIIEDAYGGATFKPHGTFKKDAIYNVTFTGLDLSGVDPANVTFVYFSPNGDYEYPEYEDLRVDLSTGTLILVNAKLPHFSRFGFVN